MALTLAELEKKLGVVEKQITNWKSEEEEKPAVILGVEEKKEELPAKGTTIEDAWMNRAWKLFPKQSVVRAYRSGDQNALYSAGAKVEFNAETLDIFGEFDSTTNYRFTAKSTGYYFISSCVTWAAANDAESWGAEIRKNGSITAFAINQASVAGLALSAVVQDLMYLEKDDYIEIYAKGVSGSNEDIEGGTTKTWLSIFRIN